jgi:hypothetical protein
MDTPKIGYRLELLDGVASSSAWRLWLRFFAGCDRQSALYGIIGVGKFEHGCRLVRHEKSPPS